jgi:hypothetical protein
MNFKKLALTLSVLLCLAACSSVNDGDGGEVLYRFDDDGVQYSPATLNGTLEYLPTMKPEKLRVVKVDKKLNPKDSFEIAVDTSYSYIHDSKGYITYYNDFYVGSSDYEAPYVKLVLIFPLNEKSKMEFSQYVRVSDRNVNIRLNLYGALAAGRIETLVREKDYSFNGAVNEAYEELEKALRQSFDMSKRFNGISSKYGVESYNDVWPYLILRHEISDSVFYRDFKEYRDVFARNGKVDASIEVRAADAFFSTFEVPSDSEYVYLFKSISRDTAVGLHAMNLNFFREVYDLDTYGLDYEVMKKDSTTDYSVVIDDQSSEYYGRSFAFEYVRAASVYTGWRVQSKEEDSLGLCRYHSQKYTEYGKKSYLCREKTREWEKLTDRDSILKYKLGECSSYSFAYVLSNKDTLLVCHRKGYDYFWEKVENVKKDSLEDFEAISIEGTERFGICDVNVGEKKKLDSLYVQCYAKRWMVIDSLSYYIGSCTSNNRNAIEKIPSGEYYKCTSDGWAPISVPSAYGDDCWNWNNSVYKKYDGKYYYCDGQAWKESPEESVYAPIVNGDPCDESHESDVKTYGDESFICREIAGDYFVWLLNKESKGK